MHTVKQRALSLSAAAALALTLAACGSNTAQTGSESSGGEEQDLVLSQDQVTLDGQVINRGGSMTGGSVSRSAGILSRANELESLRARRAALTEQLEQAQKDSLTGLLNQSAARSRAAELIEGRRPEEIQALMILDLDNFKNVNDQYGHLCGDAVLTDLAACLKRQFRGSEVIGRIGGDEFAVFLSSLSQASDAGVKAGEILAAIAALPLEGAPDLQLSCSVGIALCPADGADYQRLYQCADLALYQAKSQGKACFAYYSQELEDGPGRSGRSRSAVSSPIDSDSVCDVTEQLARYAFRMLYDAGTTEAAILQMLEVVGRAYDVSRVYIFENSADDTLCYNTFEWCGEGVSSERENLQGLSYQEDLGDYQSNFDANGIFYCRDISTLHPDLYAVLAPQGICSMLQCAILDDGRFKGYVGFDECRANRYWTQEQIESLTLVARVLSTFLVKQRLREHVQALEQRLAQEKEQ